MKEFLYIRKSQAYFSTQVDIMSTATSFLTTDALVPVPASQQFDVSRLATYLRNHLDIFPSSGDLQVSKFKHGQSNPTYLIKCKALRLVLRKKPDGDILHTAHQIEREFRVMSALQNSKVPVPKTYILCTDSSIIGTPFYVYEFVNGRIFNDPALPSLRAEARFAVYFELAKVLSAIHSVDLSASGLSEFSASSTDHVTRTMRIWNRQFNASKSSETASIAELNQFVDSINGYRRSDTRCNAIKCLVHGDYRLDNVIFDVKSLRIIAVLDWELSAIGNPLTDVAGCCLSYHVPRGVPLRPGLKGLNLRKKGIPQQLDFVRAWIQGLGLKTPLIRNFEFPIKDFNYYLAVSMYRNIAIIQGIFKRIRDGNASNQQMLARLSAKVVLAQMARQGLDALNGPDLYDVVRGGPSYLKSKNEADHFPPHLVPFRAHFENSKFFELRRKLLYFMEVLSTYFVGGRSHEQT